MEILMKVQKVFRSVFSDLGENFDFQAAMMETAEVFGCDPTKLNIFYSEKRRRGQDYY